MRQIVHLSVLFACLYDNNVTDVVLFARLRVIILIDGSAQV